MDETEIDQARLADLTMLCELAGLTVLVQHRPWRETQNARVPYVKLLNSAGGYTYVSGTAQEDWAAAMKKILVYLS